MQTCPHWRGALLALLALVAPALAQDDPIAFTGATIHTMAGPAIENGTLVIEDGKISAYRTKVKLSFKFES